MPHWLFLLLLTILLLGTFVVWGWTAYVLPALSLQNALRKLAAGDWDAPAFIRRHGRLDAAIADLTDLSERLRDTHRQLGDGSFDLQAILGSLTEGVLIVDAAQRIRLANDSLRRMFDLHAPPLERTLMEVFRNHDLQGTVRAALEEGPQSRQISLDARQGNGQPPHGAPGGANGYARKHFTVTAAALRSHDRERPRGAIAIFHDITELTALETVRRDFVANVSHELRTPVAIINGYLETLLDGAMADPPTAERFLQVMWKHNQRLTLLIEDLLSLSQLETGAAAGLQFEPVALRACLEKVVERLEATTAEKGTVIHVLIPETIPPLEGDAHRLDQVFFNLLENALKYGENAHPEVSVHAALVPGDEEIEEVEVTVTDNGPGIPLADQPHVFERFYRVRKDRSRAVGGTGLGLSIVKHVVQAHGGQVSVESEPGHGATFRVRLPLTQKG